MTFADKTKARTIRAFASDWKKYRPKLLSHGLDRIPDFEAGTRNGRTDGRNVVHVGELNHANSGAHLADHRPGGGVLDLARHPLDAELVANLQAGLPADIEDNLPSVHRCHQPFYLDGAG